MERLELLERMRRAPLLRRLPLPELDRLAARGEVCEFARDELLVEEGDRASDVFLLLEGRVAVRKRLDELGEQRIATREDSDWLGETALLDEGVRSASLVAESAVRVLRVPRSVFLEVLTRDPAATLDLLQTVHRRMAESDSRLIESLQERNRLLSDQHSRVTRENRLLRSALAAEGDFARFVGVGHAAEAVRETARRAAESDLPVLLLGETGTGKGLIARAIHSASARAPRSFVPMNCALFTEPLLESELFGHARGAFTGAVRVKEGLVEAAAGGTLFLDEVADMPPALQGALLRFLESGEFRRVGETKVRHADVRVIAATHRPLDEAVEQGLFRRDLLYRLDVIRLPLPPLRDRPEDVPALVAHCVRGVARRLGVAPLRLGADALDALAGYVFPGNVRELENEIERLYAALEPGTSVPAQALSAKIRRAMPAVSGGYSDAVRAFKARMIEQALRETGGNRTRAAERLGVHRSNLVRMMRELGVKAPRGPSPPTASA